MLCSVMRDDTQMTNDFMCAIPHLPLLTMGAITSGGTDKIAAAIRMAIFMFIW